MKKESFLRASMLVLVVIILFLQANCGGGGAASPGPVVPVDPTSTTIPIAPTPTPTTPGGITPVETPTTPPTSVPTPSATSVGPTLTPTSIPSSQIKVRVIDSYSGATVTGKTITYGAQSVGASPDGYYYMNNTGAGIMSINSTSQRTINYGGVTTSFDIGVKPDSLNDVFFWANVSQVGYHQDVIYHWNTAPTIVICKQYDSGGNITADELTYLQYCAQQYKNVIPEIQITEVDSRPQDISGWTQLTSEFGVLNGNRIAFYMGNFASSTSGQGASITNSGTKTISGGGAKVKKGLISPSHQVGLHELGHAILAGGESSEYPDIAGNYVVSVRNYPATGYASAELSETDKIILAVFFDRVAGNTKPDTDPVGTNLKINIKIDNKTVFGVNGNVVIINSDTFLP